MYNHELPPSFEYCLCCKPPPTTEKDSLEVVDWLMQHDRVLASCSRRAPNALTLAIIQGKSCVVRHLMKRFAACVNDPDWSNQRPILVAMEYRQHEILQSLLCDPHTNVNVTDKSGHTLLHLAMIYDDVTAIKIVLKHKNVDINARDSNGDTALLLAAKIHGCDQPNSKRILDSLLSHEDIRAESLDYSGRSALWHAVNTCNWQLLCLLAKFPRVQTNVPDRQGVSPLARAVIRRRLDIFNWLLATLPRDIA
ncbi:uncharacterized protein N7506_000159 [Penicillium brevicompactum]|uniref:uncharacterized protein n=1 Tax=Penicillium brevicompactum TaxID=5074 RepID=UPI002541D1E3|nr:uncharacterized protein N7506_000159 [Penicillium brevicompactum]KAJ5346906.1 hypothetical protein N7506_000159 [Penicillium brevicompactum]